MFKRANFAFVLLLVGFGLVIACTATASNRRAESVPDWGNPGGCYYGANWKCWVYNHPADQGRTSCAVVDIGYDPGHVGPFGYKRAAAAEIANIALGEGYQWAGGCYDNNDRDDRPNNYPRETKSTLSEGPDCSGLVWRVWRESNYYRPYNNSFYFWSRSTYDHGPYDTLGFKYAETGSGAPHVKYAKSGVIMMDAFASDTHIALDEIHIDAGSDLVWEALGEAYGNERVDRKLPRANEVQRRPPAGMGMTQRQRAVVRGTRSASLCALVLALALSADAEAGHMITLIDGSRAPHVPNVLEAHGPHLVMTKVRLGTVRSMRSSLTRCPDARTAERGAPVVERIGLNGRSVTFLVSRTEIAGCDRNPGARRFVGPWCGLAGWAYAGGRVGDARLAICFDGRSKPLIAFGWINPVPRARWIVIDQPGYREVYPVAGGLPVRVSTVSGLGRSGGAVFHTAQYDRNGVLLVRRKVVAAVAG